MNHTREQMRSKSIISEPSRSSGGWRGPASSAVDGDEEKAQNNACAAVHTNPLPPPPTPQPQQYCLFNPSTMGGQMGPQHQDLLQLAPPEQTHEGSL